MATPAEQYAATLLEVSKRFDNLEDETIRRLIGLLQDTRKNIALSLADNPTDFEQFRLSSLQSSVDDIISQFQSQFNADLAGSLTGASDIGLASVAEPLEAIGLNTQAFNVLSPQQLNVALDFSAELVQNISDDLRSSINTQLRLATLAQKTPFQAMKDVTRALIGEDAARAGVWGTRKRPEVVKGVAARAETIVRTEMTRMLNLAQNTTQEQAGNIVPGLLKRWVATADRRTRSTHLRAHKRYFKDPIPIDQPFRVGSSLLMYPGDPRGEAKETINCRCTMATIIPELGVTETALDKEIEKQAAKERGEKPKITIKEPELQPLRFTPETKRLQREHIANLAVARDMKTAGLPDVARSILGESRDTLQFEKDLSRVARQAGFNPARMSQPQWLKLADELEIKIGKELKFSTEVRRTGIGKLASKAGDVTKKDATKLVQNIGQQTREKATDYLENRLINFGYNKTILKGLSDNPTARLEQVRRLQAEIGHGILQKGRIGNIPLKERQRVIDLSTSDVRQLKAKSYAVQPRTAQGLDTFDLYKEATKRGGLPDPPYVPDELFEDTGESIPRYVLNPGG
jgi:hypothetical protein